MRISALPPTIPPIRAGCPALAPHWWCPHALGPLHLRCVCVASARASLRAASALRGRERVTADAQHSGSIRPHFQPASAVAAITAAAAPHARRAAPHTRCTTRAAAAQAIIPGDSVGEAVLTTGLLNFLNVSALLGAGRLAAGPASEALVGVQRARQATSKRTKRTHARRPSPHCAAHTQLYNSALIVRLVLTWFPNPPDFIQQPLA